MSAVRIMQFAIFITCGIQCGTAFIELVGYSIPAMIISALIGGAVSGALTHFFRLVTVEDYNYQPFPDNCEICLGDKGGVRGNENVIDGKVVCDYCHSDKSYLKTIPTHG